MKVCQSVLPFVLFLLFCNLALAQPDKNTPLPVDPEVRMGTLENGMKYYIKYNAKPENRAELRLAVDAGSMQEDPDQLGIAHFTEHMAFNGSTHFEKNELIDYLESVGMRFGPDLNAYTSFDETVYMLQARTDSLPLLKKGLLILQDWANGVSFDTSEIDKERGVVVSEWRSRLSPEQRLQQKYYPILYQGSRYAERLPIGDPKIIENADYETIKRFYADWYRPGLMAVVATGDFDLDWMESEIKSRFSQLPQKEDPREKKSYGVPQHDETLYAIFSDKEAAFTQVRIVYKHDREKVETIEDYRQNLARNLYNRMLNARLFELQQSATPPFTFAYSGYGNDVGDLATYTAYAFVQKGQVLEGIEAVLTETKRAVDHGFQQTELERQKEEMLTAVEKAYKEQDKTQSGRLVMRYVYHFLNDSPIPNPEQTLELYKQLLPRITLEDINPLGKKWISSKGRVVIVTGPDDESDPLPDQEAMATVLKKVDNKELKPYEDKVSDAPLMSMKPQPVEIVEEKTFNELGVTELELANGVEVVLKPTDFQNDEILMSAFSPGGHSNYSDELYQSASVAAMLVNMSGIGNFSITELQKLLTGKQVSVGPYISELYEGLSGSSAVEDLETLFQLTYLYFTAPRKDSTVLASYLSRQKAIFENMMADPDYFYANERIKLKYNDHPRRQITSLEDLEEISLEEAYQVYQDRFKDASDFTFVFVGNFEVEELKDPISRYLGNLPVVKRADHWKDVGADLVEGKIDTTIVRGQAPRARIELTWHGQMDYPESSGRYNFYSLMDILRIKLRESMREDKGGVYGVSLRGNLSKDPKEDYSITLSFNSDPERVEELIQTALKDIESVIESGVEDKNIQKVQETQRQSRIKNIKENNFWLGQLSARYRQGLSLDGIKLEVYEKYVNGLNSKDLQATAKKYFGTEHFIRLVLMPEGEQK